MARTALTFTALPEWTLPATPGALSFFEAIALAGLEGKAIRLSADTQRKLLGSNVFGKQEITVNGADSREPSTVEVHRSTAFGMDSDVGYYGVRSLRAAVAHGKKLSPGMTGPGFLNLQDSE